MNVRTKKNCMGNRMLWMDAHEIEKTTAYKSGQNARRNLQPIAQNAYPIGDAPEWSAWRAGWLDSDTALRAGYAR